MKKIYNALSIVVIALLIFFSSAFFNLKPEENLDVLEESLVQDIILRSIGFWMFGFILLMVLAVVNHTLYKNRSQSYLSIFAIGIGLNLIFAILGSLIFFFF